MTSATPTRRGKIGRGGAGAEAVPDCDEDDGDGEDQGGDGVDFGSDAAAEAGPDFERESVVAADEEERDGDFVHGEGEDQEAGGDQREFEIGKRDAEEGLQRSGAEVGAGFFLGAVEFLQAGEEFGGGYGDEGGAVAEEDGEETELSSGEDGEH